MAKKILSLLLATFFLSVVLSAPSMAAQAATAQEDDGAAFFGSFVLSLLHFPLK